MAYKTYLFVLLNIAYVYGSETNDLCPCEELELKDDSLLWTLMKKLSVDINEDEKDIFTVLPGELSPLIDCNCEEYNRKKRKVAEQPEEAPVALEDFKETKRKRYVDPDCPLHHFRFGFRCVEDDYLEY